MARLETMRIDVSPNWRNISAALKDGGKITEEEAALLVTGASVEAEITAKGFLDAMVYEAPLPPSAFFEGRTEHSHPGTYSPWLHGPGSYLEKSRIGRVRDSVKSRVDGIGETSIATAYVDRGDYPGFEYALALNAGMLDQYPTYYPRPFWTMTSILMKFKYLDDARAAARRITTRIKGKFSL